MSGLRRTAVHLALVALLLRALLPAGWMPNPQGAADAPFVICTMDGPAFTTGDKAHKQTPDDPRAHESCPFAAAAQLALGSNAVALAMPPHAVIVPPQRVILAAGTQAVRYASQSPRAPPFPT